MLEQSQDLQGRIALITSGAEGVGEVIAHQLARRGAHVLINCFRFYEQAEKTRAELEALGAKVDVFRASVAKHEQVDRMFDEIAERFGRLDVLVNNVADGWLGRVAELGEQHFKRAADTSLFGSFWCARRAAALMAANGGGCIVNISSNDAALDALTRHLAVEYAPHNVRVNTASCRLVDGGVANQFPRADEMKAVTERSTPLGRLATVEDLAGVVAFLTSDQSRLVTGQVVLADGGFSLGHGMMSAPGETDVGGSNGHPAPVPNTPAKQVGRCFLRWELTRVRDHG